MVAVAVAAQHDVGAEAHGQFAAGDGAALIGVENHAARRRLHLEAGVAVPGYFHADTSSKRF